VFNVATGSRRATAVDEVAAADVDPELVLEDGGPSRLRASVVAIFVLAATFVWLVPWAETAGAEATILADESRRYRSDDAESAGRQLYVQEGCWYCHTQQVRPIVTDVGLGPVSVVGDYVYESPVLFGVQRVGPDLMHAGSRPQTDDPAWLAGYLADPRSERSYSNMPSYDHLSRSELDDLAAYIAASR
jgi:cytochrome c oxidase cbb3-type subunit 2